MSYKEDLKGYLKIGKGEVSGILFCVFVAFVSYIVTRGMVFDDGPRLLPSSLFINDLVFSTLFKIGPIVLALILGLLINYAPFGPGGGYSGKYILRVAIVLMGARVTADVLSKAMSETCISLECGKWDGWMLSAPVIVL